MILSRIAAAVLLATSMGVANAATTLVNPEYKVDYDETTPLGGISAWGGGGSNLFFQWSFPTSTTLVSFGSTETLEVQLPSFTLSSQAGWSLSAPSAFVGYLAFTEVGGATTGILADADISVNGGVPFHLNGGIGWTPTSSSVGYLAGNFSETYTSSIGAFNSITVTNAKLVLSASGGSFSNIVSNPDTRLVVNFVAVPVPEPESYAMMLVGLGALGFMARRRQAN